LNNLKNGAGTLRRIIINNSLLELTMVVYDSITATGTKIGTVIIGAKATSPFSLEYGAPFSVGLTITMDIDSDVTFVYE